MQTWQSQIQYSVENKETHEETQGKLTTSQEKPLSQVLLPQIPPLAQKLLQYPIPIWWPFKDKPIDECITNIRCEGNCIHTACFQIQPQNLSEPKVIWYDCKEEFSD